MNKFERHSPAGKQILPETAAGDPSQKAVEVIDISDAPATLPRPPLTRSEVRTILMSLMLTMFLAALDQTIVATALPTIGGQFHDVSNLSWDHRVSAGFHGRGAGVRDAKRHLRPARHDRHGAQPIHRRIDFVRAGAEHAGADRGARPAGAWWRRHHADRADRYFRFGNPARARSVSSLFQQRVDGCRYRRTYPRRCFCRASALVHDFLDQRAARTGLIGAAAAEDEQDPGIPSQAQDRLVRGRAADGLGSRFHDGADVGRQSLSLAVA